jgi:RNA polymerase sigma-70 factor (sigma-E family)
VNATSEAEYAAFVRSRWRDLVRAAMFLGAAPHEAEDLAQQTLVRCFSAWDRVRGADNTDAYVYRMLLNQLRDARRTRWWRGRVDGEHDTTVGDTSEQHAVSDAVDRALGGLTKDQRDVVVLRYFVQLSEAQTASALGIARGTVKSRLSRAIAQLASSEHLSDLSRESR